MRLLFVSQRFGPEVAGGAETLCRELSTRLAGRGHAVEVLTSRATSYLDWADRYPAGAATFEGVEVHRLGVRRPREAEVFGPLDRRAVHGHRPSAPLLQEEWMRAQGPDLPALPAWLAANVGRFDLVAFFTYLYATTWDGMRAVGGVVPTLLHPTAHDEPTLWLSLFDATLRSATAFAWGTPEERDLIHRRLGRRPAGDVVGIGTDLSSQGDAERFRREHGLGRRPYLLYVGRLDPAKGADELVDLFGTYKRRRPRSDLALVLLGQQAMSLDGHPDIVTTGFVDEQAKRDALAGCLALAQPSYFESFSMVLTEAWALGRPALVQGRCRVLDGQTRRSGGGLPYTDYPEWEAAVDLLVERPDLAARLGTAGRRYTEANYAWGDVLGRYEALLASTVAQGRPVFSGHA